MIPGEVREREPRAAGVDSHRTRSAAAERNRNGAARMRRFHVTVVIVFIVHIANLDERQRSIYDSAESESFPVAAQSALGGRVWKQGTLRVTNLGLAKAPKGFLRPGSVNLERVISTPIENGWSEGIVT